jgi:hypothetical protein
MALVMQLARFSIVLKTAWAAWLVAAYALVLWRRRGRTEVALQPAMVPSEKLKRDGEKASKRRWRLRANDDAPVLQHSSSLLGLQ